MNIAALIWISVNDAHAAQWRTSSWKEDTAVNEPLTLTRETAEKIAMKYLNLQPEKLRVAIEGAAQRYIVPMNHIQIRIHNDWLDCCGRYFISIIDRGGAGTIRIPIHPDTLERDYEMQGKLRKMDAAMIVNLP